MRTKKHLPPINLDDIIEEHKKEKEEEVKEINLPVAPEDFLSQKIESVPVPVLQLKYMQPADIVAECRKTLNEEQQAVFDALTDFIHHKDKEYLSLIGYAGTGKTYTLSKFIEATTCKVAMTAPTNKAVKVLMDNRTVSSDRVTYTTIHKLLALKMQWVYPQKGDNWKPYQKLVENRYAEKSVNNYKIIVIDESSMLDDELFIMLKNEKEWEVKIIFMGDPAQIPPVNREDSIPLMESKRSIFNIEAHFLEKIMRQTGDNKILETAYQIRNNRFTPGDSILSRVSNKDVLFLSSASEFDTKFFMEEVKRHFASQEFKDNPNYCKVIAWTNAVVDNMNTFIRQEIFKTKDLKPIMEGEKLIADKPVIKGQTIVFNTSDEFEIVSYEPDMLTWTMPPKKKKDSFEDLLDVTDKNLFGVDVIESQDSGKGIDLHYWKAKVKYIDVIDKTEHFQLIDILDDKYEKQLSWVLARLFKARMFDQYTAWSERFARVKYNYAITAHKSQGSTYGTVFLIENDINKNQKLLERNRIKYTAATRPKKRLFLLSSLNRPLKEQGGKSK